MNRVKIKDYAHRKEMGSEADGGFVSCAETLCRVGNIPDIGSATPAKGHRHCRKS